MSVSVPSDSAHTEYERNQTNNVATVNRKKTRETERERERFDCEVK